MRLSQASLELSSSRGVFGSLENERKRREKREKQTLELKAAGIVLKCQSYLGLQNMGVYISHPMCETTRKPKIFAHTRDKEVIHQNGVVWH